MSSNGEHRGIQGAVRSHLVFKIEQVCVHLDRRVILCDEWLARVIDHRIISNRDVGDGFREVDLVPVNPGYVIGEISIDNNAGKVILGFSRIVVTRLELVVKFKAIREPLSLLPKEGSFKPDLLW